MVMPVPLELTWADGSVERIQLPAEIWKRNPRSSRSSSPRTSPCPVRIDPNRQIADADRTNNAYPSEVIPGRFGMEIHPPVATTR